MAKKSKVPSRSSGLSCFFKPSERKRWDKLAEQKEKKPSRMLYDVALEHLDAKLPAK